MYIVRRAFRNNGQMMLPGSPVEPSSIKRFKTRLNDHDIVEVIPHNFKAWNSYFMHKFGVTLPAMPNEGPVEDSAAVDDTPKEAINENKPKPVVATIKRK